MSDEPKSDGSLPDPLSRLFDNQDSASDAPNYPAALPPVGQQFSSRREARDAAGASRKSAGRGRSAAPKPPSGKLSRRDAAAVKRLAATPVIAPPPVQPSKQKKQNPFKVAFVLLVIAGFVGGVALPAAASGNALSNATGVQTAYKNAQTVKVNASIQTSKISRDAVSATSEAELTIERINAQELANAPGPKQPGDDYPWRDAGYGLSPLNYYYRQCVDFVAWRLNRDAGVTSAPWKWTWSTLTPWGGDASQWKEAWIKHGWTVSSTPVVGAVAWFLGNHVAYVHSIDGSNVTIEEYNGENSRAYAMRTIPVGSVGAYLYPPPAS